jgi:hypothetical protein
MFNRKKKILELLKLRSQKDISECAREMNSVNKKIDHLDVLKCSLEEKLSFYSDVNGINSVWHLRSNSVHTQKLSVEMDVLDEQRAFLCNEVERLAGDIKKLDARRRKIESNIQTSLKNI